MAREWAGTKHIAAALARKGEGAARQMALDLDVKESTVSRWKNGVRPKRSMWVAIEDHLDLESGTLTDLPDSPGAEYVELRGLLAALQKSTDSTIQRLTARVEVLAETIAEMQSHAAPEELGNGQVGGVS